MFFHTLHPFLECGCAVPDRHYCVTMGVEHASCPSLEHDPQSRMRLLAKRAQRGDGHVAAACDYGWWDTGRGKPTVSPVVNSQSGAPRLNPLLIPASTTALSQGGCHSTPRRPELLAACPWTLSPLTSPTNRTVAAMGSPVITPQTPKGRVSSRSTPPPMFRWKVNGDTLWLTMPTPSKPSRRSPGTVEGNSSPISTATLTPAFSWRMPSFRTAFRDRAGSTSCGPVPGDSSPLNSPTSSRVCVRP